MMSRDRVRFQIPQTKLFSSSKEQRGYLQLCAELFGIALPTNLPEPVTIICRPSQFARFLIRRNEIGLQNTFRELKPELFVPKHQPKPQMIFDVSDVPANG